MNKNKQKNANMNVLELSENKSFLSTIQNTNELRIQTTQTKILDYISIAKILSVYGVVILHTNGVFWNFQYNNYKSYWLSANLIETIFYYAVPVFVLCIGATLLDFNEKYSLKKYYYKRFEKVIIPLFCWTFILYLLKEENKKFGLTYLWNIYYGHKVYGIFGSLHDFVKIYIQIPLISYVEKKNKVKIYTYGFIILMVCKILVPYLINVLKLKIIWIYNFSFDYMVYIFAGYIIHNYKFKIIFKIFIYFLGISGFFIHLFGTQVLTIKYKKIINTHKGYQNLPCILYSCSLFLFIKEYSYLIFKIINKKFINKIGMLTLGPFFLHMPIISLITKHFNINTYNLSYRLFGGFAICSLCLIITAILKKIPLIKYLVP